MQSSGIWGRGEKRDRAKGAHRRDGPQGRGEDKQPLEKSELQAGAPQKAPREGLSENEAGSPAAPDTRITCWVGSRPARLVAQVLLDCVEKARVGRRSLSSEGEENMTNWPQNYERGSGAWTGQRGGGSGQELDNRNPLSPAAPTAMAEIHVLILFPFLQLGKLRLRWAVIGSSSRLQWREVGKSPFVKVPRGHRGPG